jgi:hypothetical protein
MAGLTEGFFNLCFNKGSYEENPYGMNGSERASDLGVKGLTFWSLP